MQESRRYVVERAKGTAHISVTELVHAMQVLPNGWGVVGIQNRDDGTTIVQVRREQRENVALPR